jgi:hypothetical protein
MAEGRPGLLVAAMRRMADARDGQDALFKHNSIDEAILDLFRATDSVLIPRLIRFYEVFAGALPSPVSLEALFRDTSTAPDDGRIVAQAHGARVVDALWMGGEETMRYADAVLDVGEEPLCAHRLVNEYRTAIVTAIANIDLRLKMLAGSRGSGLVGSGTYADGVTFKQLACGVDDTVRVTFACYAAELVLNAEIRAGTRPVSSFAAHEGVRRREALFRRLTRLKYGPENGVGTDHLVIAITDPAWSHEYASVMEKLLPGIAAAGCITSMV